MGVAWYLNEEIESCCHPQQRQQRQAELEPPPSRAAPWQHAGREGTPMLRTSAALLESRHPSCRSENTLDTMCIRYGAHKL